MTEPGLLQDGEIKAYWDRLCLKGNTEAKKESEPILTIESGKEPCKVGLPVNEQAGCPLCRIENPHSDIAEFMSIVNQVVRARRPHKEA